MAMTRYFHETAPVPPDEVPFSRPWAEREWPRVCALRAQLDDLLLQVAGAQLDPALVGKLRHIGPQLPCFSMQAGRYLVLETSVGTVTQLVPSGEPERKQLHYQLSYAVRGEKSIAELPAAEGWYEHRDESWERRWALRNQQPCALVVDAALLGDRARWYVCEAHERAHAVGLSDHLAVLVEIAVAERLCEIYDGEELGSNAAELLAESRTRLSRTAID